MARKRKELRSATKLKLEQIIRLQMLDHSVEQIADTLSMTSGSVTELLRHPEYDSLRDAYVAKTYGALDKVIEVRKAQVILDDLAPDAAGALAEILANSDDEINKRLTATAVLDRTGHGPIQRKAVKHRHELDPVSAKLLGDAMKEADAIRPQTIDVEVVEDA